MEKMEKSVQLIESTGLELEVRSKTVKEIIDNLPKKEDWIGTDSLSKEDEEEFKMILRRRINHCASQLLRGKDNAYSILDGEVVVFKDGTHFSFPVYNILLDARSIPVKSWNSLVWQQIARQMFIDNNRNEHLFRIATERMLVVGVSEYRN